MSSTTTTFPIDRIARLPEVMQILGLRRSSIFNGVAEGRIPRPVRIGARAVGWRVSELQAHLAGLTVTPR